MSYQEPRALSRQPDPMGGLVEAMAAKSIAAGLGVVYGDVLLAQISSSVVVRPKLRVDRWLGVGAALWSTAQGLVHHSEITGTLLMVPHVPPRHSRARG